MNFFILFLLESILPDIEKRQGLEYQMLKL